MRKGRAVHILGKLGSWSTATRCRVPAPRLSESTENLVSKLALSLSGNYTNRGKLQAYFLRLPD